MVLNSLSRSASTWRNRAFTDSRVAEAADVSLETVKRIESMEGELKIRLDTLTKIKTALEKAGIEFLAENGGGPGVRLRKPQRLVRPK
jgi:DNA-binding Xre family transcriptional regulator